jgi:GTP-binding protein HflX
MNKEHVLLVGVKFQKDSLETVYESLEELKELAATAGAHVEDTVLQQRREPDSKTFIGKGKTEEIKQFSESRENISSIIFNHELTSSQIRNLEKELELKVITRTELILDIFALHARSQTAQMQVELAQLSYQLPRIIGKGISLSRQGGGIGTRGPGEKQLELDRRLIEKRIFLIRKKLAKIETERREQRKQRLENEFKIAIVGYTNSGKSTLLNRLTKADALVEDKLFATLDTTTRKLWLGDNEKQKNVVLTDTVGFIQGIPHGLIESFRSTLEDTLKANLLIHVIDSSSPTFIKKKKVVEETLFEMGADSIPILLCFNKTDKVSEERLLKIQGEFPGAVFISASKNINLDKLKEDIKVSLNKL